MNFQNLINKIGELDKPITQLKEQAEFKFSSDMDLNAVKKLSGLNESEVAECGMSPMGGLMGGASTPPVTMNVSMNASGTESIRDLMDLLKGADGAGDAVSGPVGVVSVSGDDHDTDDFDRSNDDDADDLDREIDEIEVAEISDPANAPDERYGTMADAAPKGNDLNSHGGNEAEKVNGGGNPYAQVSEGLMAQLQNLYTEIKNR